MKNCKKNVLKSRNGITLIALVITIIVLLILAGISISMLSGDNSILQKATDAKINTDNAQIKERIQLAGMAAAMVQKGNITYSNLIAQLNKEFKGATEGTEVGYYKITSGDETTDTWTVTVYTTVGEVSEEIKGILEETKTIGIAYTLDKNKVRMNFEKNKLDLEMYISNLSTEKQEAIVVKIAKAYMSDYFEEKYPGQEIDINLIYRDAGNASNLQEYAEYMRCSSITEYIMGGKGSPDFYDIIGVEGITGTITLKKGDTVITQGDVSLLNDLEYTLTDDGPYTIIGETRDGIKSENKTFDYVFK